MQQLRFAEAVASSFRRELLADLIAGRSHLPVLRVGLLNCAPSPGERRYSSLPRAPV